jgi:restriction system protein
MAEITRKRIGEIVRKVFEVLLPHPEGMRAKDLLAQVEQSMTLSEFEKSDYPNRPGVRRFEKTARFATIAPVKAGWLIKSKGRWILTEDGKSAYEQFKDPDTLAKRASELYRQWKAGQPETIPEGEESAAASATTTLEEAEELAWAEIEEHLRSMNPYDLQALVAALLKAMGYHVSWISPPGPDQGIDIVAHTDPLGASNPRIKVQVKRHAKSIDADGLRSFMALLGHQDVGFLSQLADSQAALSVKRVLKRPEK